MFQTYRARDGEELPFRYYSAETNIVIVLLHGIIEDSKYLSKLAKSLADKNIAHVYTPDLRGYGEKPKKRGDISYIGQHEDDLVDFFIYIQQKHDQAKIILAGHSAGGGTILRMIENEHVECIDGFLFLAPYIHPTAPTINKANEKSKVKLSIGKLIVLFILNRLGIRLFNSSIVYKRNKPIVESEGSDTLALSLRLFVSRYPKNYLTALTKIDKPALVLVGNQDEEFDHTELESLFTDYTEAHTTIVENANHHGVLNDETTLNEIKNWIMSDHFLL